MLLNWSVRESFTRYVLDAEGTVVVEAPATQNGNVFTFPGASVGDSVFEFQGGVTFRAYEGMLEVALSDPVINLEDARPALSVQLRRGSVVSRMDLAVLENVSTGPVLRADVRLTSQGSQVFGGSYQPGDPLDPIEIHTA